MKKLLSMDMCACNHFFDQRYGEVRKIGFLGLAKNASMFFFSLFSLFYYLFIIYYLFIYYYYLLLLSIISDVYRDLSSKSHDKSYFSWTLLGVES